MQKLADEKPAPAPKVIASAAAGVTIQDFAFGPASVTVNVGDTVTWTNQDDIGHTATADGGQFNTGILNKGQSGSATFDTAGTFTYYCQPHPNMKGTIVVQAASTGGSDDGTAGSTDGTRVLRDRRRRGRRRPLAPLHGDGRTRPRTRRAPHAGARCRRPAARGCRRRAARRSHRLVSSGRKIRVVVAKPGLDGHDRGAKIIARALRDAGMEVIYTGLHQTPEQIVETVIQEDADAVGLSILSGAHMTLVPRIAEGLKTAGADEVILVVGGTIPGEDIPELKELGVAEVFTPGSPVQGIVDYIRSAVPA